MSSKKGYEFIVRLPGRTMTGGMSSAGLHIAPVSSRKRSKEANRGQPGKLCNYEGTYDQQGAGFPRVSNGRIDIGAYEFKPSSILFLLPPMVRDRNTTLK